MVRLVSVVVCACAVVLDTTQHTHKLIEPSAMSIKVEAGIAERQVERGYGRERSTLERAYYNAQTAFT